SLFGLSDIDINGNILRWYAPVGLLFAMFTVTSSVLQGINEQRFAVISLSAGLLMKILFNTILIHSFGAIGAVIATGLASGTAVVLNMWRIRSAINFSFKQTFKRTALGLIFVLFMLIGVMIVKGLLGIFLDYTESRAEAILTLTGCVLVGAGVELWVAYRSTLLERTCGNRNRVVDRRRNKRWGVMVLRLDKLVSNMGLGRRKEVKVLFRKKRVTLNGAEVVNGRTHVNPSEDIVKVDGDVVHYRKYIYVML